MQTKLRDQVHGHVPPYRDGRDRGREEGRQGEEGGGELHVEYEDSPGIRKERVIVRMWEANEWQRNEMRQRKRSTQYVRPQNKPERVKEKWLRELEEKLGDARMATLYRPQGAMSG